MTMCFPTKSVFFKTYWVGGVREGKSKYRNEKGIGDLNANNYAMLITYSRS